MRSLILHIGRHKTGTSSIQKKFVENQKAVLDAGVFYPLLGLRGYGHHIIAEKLSRQNIRKKGEEVYHDQELMSFLYCLNEKKSFDLVVSSEAFQNCDPKVIKRYFKDFDVKVVVYIRNKIDYLCSAYSQKIHATSYNGSLKDFYFDIFRVDYISFIDSWLECFDDVNVRVFDKDFLVNGNVVDDFISYVPSLKDVDLKMVEDVNPSLGVNLLAIKKYLNRCGDESFSYSFFSKLAGYGYDDKLRVNSEFKKEVIPQLLEEEVFLNERLKFGDGFFKYEKYNEGENVLSRDLISFFVDELCAYNKISKDFFCIDSILMDRYWLW